MKRCWHYVDYVHVITATNIDHVGSDICCFHAAYMRAHEHIYKNSNVSQVKVVSVGE